MSEAIRRAVVLCPLAHEAAAIHRHLQLPHYMMPRVVRTGPGAAAICSAVERVARENDEHAALLVILAGVAGGLAPVAQVPAIRAVVTEDGTAYPVPFTRPHVDGEEPVTLLGIDVPLTSPAIKQEWNELTGAAIVDTESHAFAKACTERGLTWTVVRGVSDAYDEVLPPRVVRWVTPSGTTRPVRAALDLIRRPKLLPEVCRLARRTKACLPLVASRVADRVRAWHGQGLDRA